ncbi:MAG: ATP-grasp domain-containing protein [Odoribacter splanchnicus]
MKKLAVIGANEPLEVYYRQAKKLGCQLIGIAYEQGAVCKKYCDKFFPISFVDKDSVLEVCRQEKIDGITSFSLESALPTVIYVAQKLGLVSNTEECAKRMANKYTMRETFKNAGIRNPWYHLISNIEDLNDKEITFPCIVKPIDSGGSQGVTMVDEFSKLKNAFNRAAEFTKSGRFIVEEYIDGREFSVEYLTYNGKHVNVQITDKVTSGAPYFVELQHHQPANLSEKQRKQIRDLVESALDALGVTNSPTHAEIKMNSKGELYVIEIGGRLGGDYITSDLVRLSTGFDMVKGAIEIATGDFRIPQIQNIAYSGIYFYSSLTSTIKKYIDSKDEFPYIVQAEFTAGAVSDCQKNADRNGFFIYQSDHKLSL